MNLNKADLVQEKAVKMVAERAGYIANAEMVPDALPVAFHFAKLLILEQQRTEKMAELLREVRDCPDEIDHGRCMFRKYPDWKELQDDRCDWCKRVDVALGERKL